MWIVIDNQAEFRICKETLVVFGQATITVVKEWCVYPGEGATVFETTTDIFQLVADVYSLLCRCTGNTYPKRKVGGS
jgi:hypothetical protein